MISSWVGWEKSILLPPWCVVILQTAFWWLTSCSYRNDWFFHDTTQVSKFHHPMYSILLCCWRNGYVMACWSDPEVRTAISIFLMFFGLILVFLVRSKSSFWPSDSPLFFVLALVVNVYVFIDGVIAFFDYYRLSFDSAATVLMRVFLLTKKNPRDS